MLQNFLADNRFELIKRCRAKVALRRAPGATPAELEYGIPLFLDQLTGMLENQVKKPGESSAARTARVSGAETKIEDGAKSHGSELLGSDFTIEQVVHDYGDLCQAITELASEKGAPITVAEFGLLNIRLDNAIAGAVTEYSRGRQVIGAQEGAVEMNERLGVLAHEMRNLLNTTMLALTAIRRGGVGFGGATAGALDRSLIGMRELIDRTLAEVRLEVGMPIWKETIEMRSFIAEVRVGAALEATQKGCEFSVEPPEPGVLVEADRHILASALSNLLQNAFKFTRPGTEVQLRASSTKDRVLIEVEDACGGLSKEAEQAIFRPFEQAGADRTGLGLGLSLSREGVRRFGGKLSARSIAGKGCVFTIDLPRKA